MGKDSTRPEQKFVDIEAAIKACLPEEVGDCKGATLDCLANRGTPPPAGRSYIIDLQRAHIEPEVL